jgi:hypothetical protein
MNVIISRCDIGTWADQAHLARTPAVGSHHIGGDRSFVEKYQARGVKQPLLAYPAPPRPSHVGPLALCGLQAFFDGDVVAREETRERTTAGFDAAPRRAGSEAFNEVGIPGGGNGSATV